jgi:hypothetical protein
MLGIPPWVWVLVVLLLVIAAAVRSFYSRWRGMCRGIRGDLTAFLKERYPEVTVLREEMGNLVVRTPDGEERVWEMADLYAEVARLPGMGADPQARARLYQQAADAFFPGGTGGGPLSLETHGPRIRPQLVPAAALEGQEGAAVLRTEIAGLGLAAVYQLGGRFLTEEDRAQLGVELTRLHALALENLRQRFPAEMVAAASQSESGSAVQLGDSHDAARLLLVPEHLGPAQSVIALVPHRDLMVLLPASQAQDPEKLQEGLKLLECDHPPVLSRPVRVTSEGFRLL